MIHPRLLACIQALHQHTKKGEAWRWTEAEQEAFKELKQLIMLTPTLIQPNQDMQFQLEMDASGYATEAVLSQLCKVDKWHQSSEAWKSGGTFWKEFETQ